jgi:hypothetical protein
MEISRQHDDHDGCHRHSQALLSQPKHDYQHRPRMRPTNSWSHASAAAAAAAAAGAASTAAAAATDAVVDISMLVVAHREGANTIVEVTDDASNLGDESSVHHDYFVVVIVVGYTDCVLPCFFLFPLRLFLFLS